MKIIKRRKENASSSYSEDEYLSDLSNLKLRGAVNIRLELDHWFDETEINWNYESLETDEEYSARLKFEEEELKAKAKATKKKQESILSKREKDRALYEKLKKEFGE